MRMSPHAADLAKLLFLLLVPGILAHDFECNETKLCEMLEPFGVTYTRDYYGTTSSFTRGLARMLNDYNPPQTIADYDNDAWAAFRTNCLDITGFRLSASEAADGDCKWCHNEHQPYYDEFYPGESKIPDYFGGDPAIGTYAGEGWGGVPWDQNKTCCKTADDFKRCCTRSRYTYLYEAYETEALSVHCQPLLDIAYAAQCWGEQVSCGGGIFFDVDEPEVMSNFWRRNGSNPLVFELWKPSESPTASASVTASPSETPSETQTASRTPSQTQTPSSSQSQSTSETPSQSPSTSQTPSETASSTESPSESSSQTSSPSQSASSSPSASKSPTSSPSATRSPTPSRTASPSPSKLWEVSLRVEVRFSLDVEPTDEDLAAISTRTADLVGISSGQVRTTLESDESGKSASSTYSVLIQIWMLADEVKQSSVHAMLDTDSELQSIVNAVGIGGATVSGAVASMGGLESWYTFKASDNLRQVPSYAESFPRDVVWPNVLLWNDMDADVSVDCDAATVQTEASCEYVLRTTIRNFQPAGYTGVRVWSTYNADGYNKLLLVDNHYVWTDPECTMDGNECELLPITDPADGTRSTVAFEFRMAKLENDDRYNPFFVEMIDETLVAHGLRPAMNDTLVSYADYGLIEGQSFDFDHLMDSDNKEAFVVLCVLAAFVIVLLCIFCYALCKKPVVHSKKAYVLDTRGIRCIAVGGQRQLRDVDSINRNRFAKRHYPYVLIVLAWRIAYAFIFTITFFTWTFQSINKQHYDTMDQWSLFEAHRDAQIVALMEQVEDYYQAEQARIARAQNYTKNLCDVTKDMEEAFLSDSAAIEAYHDYQMAMRMAGNQSAGVAVTVLSANLACSTDTAAGAAFVTNSLYEDEAMTIPWDLTNLTNAEIDMRLAATCEADIACRGFSFNETGRVYHLYTSMPSPQVSTDTPGFCKSVASVMLAYPDVDEINAALLEAYVAEINQTYTDLGNLISAMRSAPEDSEYYVILDTGTNQTFGFHDWAARYFRDSSGNSQSNYQLSFGCPGCTLGIEAPPLILTSETDAGKHNETFRSTVNSSWEIATYFLDLASKSVNVTDAEFSFLEKPDFEFDWYNIDWDPRIATVVLSIDVILIVYRTLVTISILNHYITGLEKDIPITLLGKRHDINWMKRYCVSAIFFPYFKWFYKKAKRMDKTIWILFGKVLFLFQLAIIFCILLVAFWIVDNMVSLETFDQFGVFNAMTAAPSAQQTLRNEQLAVTAHTYNRANQVSLQYSINTKASELMTRQASFNVDEYRSIESFNEDYCDAVETELADPVQLVLTGSAVGGIRSTGTLSWQLDSAEVDTTNVYTVDTVLLPIRWNRPATPSTCDDATCGHTNSGLLCSEGCFVPDDLANLNASGLQYRLTLRAPDSTGQMTAVYTHESTWHPISDYDTFPKCHPIYTAVCGGLAVSTTYSLPVTIGTIGDRAYLGSASQLDIEVLATSSLFSLDALPTVTAIEQDPSQFSCDGVEHLELDFQPSEYIGECESLNPISINMISRFNRNNWTLDLKEGHMPFINAMRQITLSPFYIAVVAVASVFVIYLFLALLEYAMVKADLVRENTFCKVPCRIAKGNKQFLSTLQVQKDDDDRNGYKGGYDSLASDGGANTSGFSGAASDDGESDSSTDDDVGVNHNRHTGAWQAVPRRPRPAHLDPATITSMVEVQIPVPMDQIEDDVSLTSGRATEATAVAEGGAGGVIEMQDLGGMQGGNQGAEARNDSGDAGEGSFGNLWVEVLTDDGQVYYYNPETNDTTWEKPDGLVDSIHDAAL